MASWQKVGEGIWARTYIFNGNPLTNSLIDIGDGGLMAVSPGTDLSAADFDAVDKLGTVKALLSPGAFHNMGLPVWNERYPDASIYGPTSAISHIAKAHKKLPALQHLSALNDVLPDDVHVEEVAGMHHADAFVAVSRDDGTTWFTNEVITNWEGWPSKFMFRMIFKFTGSGPGLNVNTMAVKLVKGKKAEIRAFYEAKLASHKPTRLVPCHHAVIEDPELGSKLADVLANRLS